MAGPSFARINQIYSFQFRGSSCQYTVTPFRISTSQAILSTDQDFENIVENFTLVDIDDTYDISPDFQSFIAVGIYISGKKTIQVCISKFCQVLFCRTTVPLIFIIITATELKMNENKVQPILNFQTPKSRKQIIRITRIHKLF